MSEKFAGISAETGILATRMTCDRCSTTETLKLPRAFWGCPYPGWDMMPGREPYRDLCAACVGRAG